MLDPLDPCRAAFARADREVVALAARTGLACPPGCGACCLSPDVETTAAELRPLAAELVRSGRAAEVLARLEAAPAERRCALYAPASEDGRLGRCTAYAERPLVCRMFGFAARRGRSGAAELAACRTMRAADPEAVERALRDVAAGGAAPVIADHVLALAAELTGAGPRREPINVALAQALRRALLAARFAAESEPLLVLLGPLEGPPVEPPEDRRPPTQPRAA